MCISVTPCGGSAWPRKNPSRRCLEAEEEEQQGRARSSCASLSDKSRRMSRDTSVPFIISFVCRMHPPQLREAWALLGGCGEKQCPQLGTRCPQLGTKCPQLGTKWFEGSVTQDGGMQGQHGQLS